MLKTDIRAKDSTQKAVDQKSPADIRKVIPQNFKVGRKIKLEKGLRHHRRPTLTLHSFKKKEIVLMWK